MGDHGGAPGGDGARRVLGERDSGGARGTDGGAHGGRGDVSAAGGAAARHRARAGVEE